MTAAIGLLNQQREARRRELSLLNTGLYTSSADPGITENIRRRNQLSKERAAQNAMLKAIRLGKFGQRSLLSGSFAGISDEAAARQSMGGTSPGITVSSNAGSLAAPARATGGRKKVPLL